jgi:hypothetical protein
VPLVEQFDVGAFTIEPGKAGFSSASVVSFVRQEVHSGPQTLKWIADRKPKFLGIDPYNKRVDRNSEDNVMAIGAGT